MDSIESTAAFYAVGRLDDGALALGAMVARMLCNRERTLSRLWGRPNQQIHSIQNLGGNSLSDNHFRGPVGARENTLKGDF